MTTETAVSPPSLLSLSLTVSLAASFDIYRLSRGTRQPGLPTEFSEFPGRGSQRIRERIRKRGKIRWKKDILMSSFHTKSRSRAPDAGMTGNDPARNIPSPL